MGFIEEFKNHKNDLYAKIKIRNKVGVNIFLHDFIVDGFRKNIRTTREVHRLSFVSYQFVCNSGNLGNGTRYKR